MKEKDKKTRIIRNNAYFEEIFLKRNTYQLSSIFQDNA